MNWPLLISGFVLGATGSLHCIGMCGPLSLILPTQHQPGVKKFISLLLYQAGRIISYTVLGVVVGMAGKGIYSAGYQQWFSIAAGLTILALAIAYFGRRQIVSPAFSRRAYQPIHHFIAYASRHAKGIHGFLLMGIANGLLPCGMVYIAVITTFTFTTITESAGFMVMFGLGTLPAMMMAAYAVQKLKWESRIILRRAVPFFMMAMGVLLVLRGLNLGIPFISPYLPENTKHGIVCHP